MLLLDVSPDGGNYAFLEVEPLPTGDELSPCRDVNLSVICFVCGSPALPSHTP